MAGLFDDVLESTNKLQPTGLFDDVLAPREGRGTALARGLAQGVTANWLDELTGLRAAGGAMGPLVGAGLLGYEKLTGKGGGATKAYEEARDVERAKAKESEKQFPGTTLTGQIVGGLGVPVGGMGGAATLGARMLRGAGVGAGFGAAAGAGAGEGATDTATKGLLGGVIGAPIGAIAPPLVEGLIRGGQAISAPLVNAVRGAINPEAEAARRVAGAIGTDIRNDPNAAARVTPAEFQAASHKGGPATLMDLGGETTRGLARSAANTSPEGRFALNQAIDNRFEGQGGRVTDWLEGTFHYPNAEAQQRAIDATARSVNRPAYARAYDAGDKPIWSPELERLSASPTVLGAMRGAERKWKDWQVIDGFGAMNPPARVENGGILSFGGGGLKTFPNIQYWDYTARDLAGRAQTARAAGNMSEAARYGGLEKAIKTELDQIVPEFGEARLGAKGFFGAENALEAGENFVGAGARFGNREARTALSKMLPPERQLFQDGYVSRLVERIRAAPDRRNVINQMAQSPAAREELHIALGPQRANEIEAGLRIEGIMDLARGAVQGNSTTARQLAELGLAGGAGSMGGLGIYHQDPTQMTIGAVAGALMAGRRFVDTRVATRVAQLLTSQDRQQLIRGIRIVTNNGRMMDNLRLTDQHIAAAGGQQAPNAGIARANAAEPDQLIPPPRNPAAPPEALANAIKSGVQHNVDWAKFPGQVMQGIQPETPGMWSEGDEYRAQDLLKRRYDWGPQTAFSDVFWPRAGGAGQLTSGAGSRIPPDGGRFKQFQQQMADLKMADLKNKPASTDVEQQVRRAFFDLAGNPPQDAVRLNALRAKLSNIPKDEIDKALLRMKESREANLMNLDNPRDIAAVGDSKLSQGRNDYHTVWIDPISVAGSRIPPRIGASQAPAISGKGTPEITSATPMSAPNPLDTRGPWGQSPPPVTRGAGSTGEKASKTDEALAAIQDALRAHGETSSGVPLVGPAGPKKTTEEVLAAIQDALNIAEVKPSAAGSKMMQPSGGADIPGLAKQLKQALFSDNRQEFPALIQSLKDSLSVSDAKALAQAFSGNRATSKIDAINKISERWESLEKGRLRALSIGDRTAG